MRIQDDDHSTVTSSASHTANSPTTVLPDPTSPWINRIIGRGFNQREKLQDPTAHAEILALTEARRLYRELEALARAADDSTHLAWAWVGRAYAHYLESHPDSAATLYALLDKYYPDELEPLLPAG